MMPPDIHWIVFGLSPSRRYAKKIAKKGKEIGARFVLTFVEEDNIPSLKACERAGFSPYAVRTDRWVFFRRHSEFETLPQNVTA